MENISQETNLTKERLANLEDEFKSLINQALDLPFVEARDFFRFINNELLSIPSFEGVNLVCNVCKNRRTILCDACVRNVFKASGKPEKRIDGLDLHLELHELNCVYKKLIELTETQKLQLQIAEEERNKINNN